MKILGVAVCNSSDRISIRIHASESARCCSKSIHIKKDKDRNVGKIRQQNETLILRAAEVEFAEKGFAGASINAIANRAGLPKAKYTLLFQK
ncbi:MAG: TetR/AcrR family transcriptional regulator [Nitrincola sp.]|nr:TetR/AcrR family transcriptional regulator [Nitrincola sp.]